MNSWYGARCRTSYEAPFIGSRETRLLLLCHSQVKFSAVQSVVTNPPPPPQPPHRQESQNPDLFWASKVAKQVTDIYAIQRMCMSHCKSANMIKSQLKDTPNLPHMLLQIWSQIKECCDVGLQRDVVIAYKIVYALQENNIIILQSHQNCPTTLFATPLYCAGPY